MTVRALLEQTFAEASHSINSLIIMNRYTTSCLLTLILLTGGCASLDLDKPKSTSYAYQASDSTRLDTITRVYEITHPGESGFELQFDGVQSLAARLAAAELAEVSIDTQYYLIKDDLVGYVFIGSLLEAADRGVRVRLLLDDIFTQGFDEGFVALDSHPNFEVRLFNPWASRKNRFADLFSFKRLNRRMHTKSFTVDNEVTIVGGRNIADEYYGASLNTNFGDIDVMAIGPVVREVSTMFDQFWNSRLSVPVTDFAKLPADPNATLTQLRAEIRRQLDMVSQSKYEKAVTSDFETYLQSEPDIFTWAPYVLAYDPPAKADSAEKKEEIPNIVEPLADAVDRAQQQLVNVSPYFVPRKEGIEYFKELRERGLEVYVVTNSLAANNHTIVHSGYAPSREPLLRLGVKIYEVKANVSLDDLERAGTENTLSTLHSKAFLVDDNELFVGSFNWDPRSINLNTESGVIIDSPKLADELLQRITSGEGRKAYEVVLKEGRLIWLDSSGGEIIELSKEPDTTWWKRTKAALGELLPIRGHL